MADPLLTFADGRPIPGAVAGGRLEGVLREPLDDLPAGSPWSGTVVLAVEGGGYVVYYSYGIQGRRNRDGARESVGLAEGEEMPRVLRAAMRLVVKAIERRRVGAYAQQTATPRRCLFRVTRSEWVRH